MFERKQTKPKMLNGTVILGEISLNFLQNSFTTDHTSKKGNNLEQIKHQKFYDALEEDVSDEGSELSSDYGSVEINGPGVTMATNKLASDSMESLFIGNLHKNVTEELLRGVFGVYPGFISAKICYNAITKKSLGHGYLNFSNKIDAIRATKDLNYCNILSSEIRLMPSMRNAAYRKQIGTNVFMSNLPLDIPFLTTRFFYVYFSGFGEVLSCKLVEEKGIGFIYFESNTVANYVVNLFNGSLLYGKQVFCSIHKSKEERSLDENKVNQEVMTPLEPKVHQQRQQTSPDKSVRLFNLNLMCKKKFIKHVLQQHALEFHCIEQVSFDSTSETLSMVIKAKNASQARKIYRFFNGKLLCGSIVSADLE
ncbi:uncharacterized protein KNAG_0C02030 [Huiozyma naganishii CBS 8797]|uniref:RRM domain-containing protein n=1 Tax=Huiozyma naganishii (strain ATCC MYA-139 / BCRC 22969 / CBS 8797 / KCTC 17520 / NBRC 10181 / NCYC 3082 / Yp74L-3) TaxID=1071383 RepID=J7R3A9_HUIN7|nr:hypothetical protein KNAG_0C02030 [Kazachstania naganishii CBS 8797]CCK69315.1 hypothetical protein KNAG_0C02030 [Kazachstania naganishii CBS 8797]